MHLSSGMGHRVRTRWQLKYDNLEFGVVTSSEGLEAWLRPENYKVGGNGRSCFQIGSGYNISRRKVEV